MHKTLYGAVMALTLMAALPATAATYTYEIDYSFPILRVNGTGSASYPTKLRDGKGSVTGTITLDESFDTTYRILSFDLVSTNTATGFSATNTLTYRSTDANDTYSRTVPGVWDATTTQTFNNPDSAIGCDAGLIAPSGQHANRAYRVGGSTLSLYIDKAFKAGNATMRLLGSERFGIAPLCGSAGFADLGYEHTAYSRTDFVMAGTLRADDSGDGNLPSVPVPASLPLLLGGVGLIAALRRRKAA